jgi:hypothetical protein
MEYLHGARHFRRCVQRLALESEELARLEFSTVEQRFQNETLLPQKIQFRALPGCRV